MASMNISKRWRLGMNCEVSRVGEGGSEEEETMISRDTGPLRGMDYSQIA